MVNLNTCGVHPNVTFLRKHTHQLIFGFSSIRHKESDLKIILQFFVCNILYHIIGAIYIIDKILKKLFRFKVEKSPQSVP